MPKDQVEVADVDAELERGGADDAGVAAALEALLGEFALLEGDRAVMDEDVGAAVAGPVGDDLGERPALAEEQALVAARPGRGSVGQGGEGGVEFDAQAAPGRLPGRIDDHPLAPRGALDPGQDGLGITDRGAEADALDVVVGEAGQALDDAHEMGAAVASGHGVDLVDDDEAQVDEQLLGRDLGRHQHDLERLGRGHQEIHRLLQKPPARALADVAVPQETVAADHLGVEAETLGLVVEQGLDGRDVQGPDRFAVSRMRDEIGQHREHRGLGLAARGRGQDHGVLAVEDGVSRQVLDRAQRTPAEAGDDGLLQPGREPRKSAARGHGDVLAAALDTALTTRPRAGCRRRRRRPPVPAARPDCAAPPG